MVEARKGGFSVEPFVFIGGKLVTWHDAKTTQSLDGGRTFPSRASRGTATTGASRSRLSPCSAGGTRRSPTCSTASRTGRVSGDGHAAVPRGTAVPGESAVAVPQHARRRRHDSPALARRTRRCSVNGETAVVSLTPPNGFGAATFDQGNIVDYLRDGALPPTPNVRGHVRPRVRRPGVHRRRSIAARPRVVEIALPLHAAPSRSVERERRARRTRAARSRGRRAAHVARRDRARDDRAPAVRVPRGQLAVREPRRTSWSTATAPAIQPGLALLRALVDPRRLARPRRRCCAWARPTWRASSSSGSRASSTRTARCRAAWTRAAPIPCPNTTATASSSTSWPSTGDTPATARSRSAVAARAAGGGCTSTRCAAAPHAGVPGRRQARVLRAPAAVDQPRGLLGQADALVLGRLLRAARAQGRRGARARVWAARRRRAARRAARRVPARPLRVDRSSRWRSTASTTFPAPPTSATSTPRRRRSRSRPSASWAACPRPSRARSSGRSSATGTEFVARRDGTKPWDALHAVRAAHRRRLRAARLARSRARSCSTGSSRDQRPAGWHQWAEVVWHDPTTPKFIGDMPHTWVGSDFVRSVLDMFAYEREADSSLVVGAGIPESWVMEKPGVTVRDSRRITGRSATRSAMKTAGRACRCPDGPNDPSGWDRRAFAVREVGE